MRGIAQLLVKGRNALAVFQAGLLQRGDRVLKLIDLRHGRFGQPFEAGSLRIGNAGRFVARGLFTFELLAKEFLFSIGFLALARFERQLIVASCDGCLGKLAFRFRLAPSPVRLMDDASQESDRRN